VLEKHAKCRLHKKDAEKKSTKLPFLQLVSDKKIALLNQKIAEKVPFEIWPTSENSLKYALCCNEIVNKH